LRPGDVKKKEGKVSTYYGSETWFSDVEEYEIRRN